MIPIKYLLDTDDESEYIKLVLSCIKDKKAYADKVKKLLEDMERAGYHIGRKILEDADRFSENHADYFCLCKWLILSYEEMEQIKIYLDKIIRNNLSYINNYIKNKKIKRIKIIKSYHDLVGRRKKSYAKDKRLHEFLNNPIDYDNIFNNFADFIKIYEKFPKEGINSWIVEKTGMKVCPYCNISYTYNRGNSVTAQLDHFFPKSEYPMFALCFFNLIPSCSACNKMKNDGIENMASPYKQNAFKDLRITWNYKDSTARGKKKYQKNHSLEALEKMIEIKIQTQDNAEKCNLNKMKINEAYQQHTDYAAEVIAKVKTYANHEAQKLICNICPSVGITTDEVERFYFGNYLNEDMKKRPLSKLTKDFYEEYQKAIF